MYEILESTATVETKPAAEPVFIGGFDFTIKAGTLVRPDKWCTAEKLIPGDSFSDLRLSTGRKLIESLAVKIEITGRKTTKDRGIIAVRCKITFLGDCEPDTVCGGWIWRNWDRSSTNGTWNSVAGWKE